VSLISIILEFFWVQVSTGIGLENLVETVFGDGRSRRPTDFCLYSTVDREICVFGLILLCGWMIEDELDLREFFDH
jgi:hypothetical protein